MKRLLILTTLIALLACASSYLYLHSKERRNSEKIALAPFREGDYQAAERILTKYEPTIFPLALYNSYLATAKGHFRESDYFLQTILQHSPQNQELLVQTYLTQAINAYSTNNELEVTPLIDRAKRLTNGSSVLMFFEGLSNYLHKHYAEAIRFWSAYSPEKTWMDSVIESCFPLSWRQLHVAHCLSEEGDILSSREILEKQSHLLERDPHNYHQLATLFLGLTYLKEAQEVPPCSRGSYYKLARFYFERSGREMRFDRERQRIADHVANEALALLTSTADCEMHDWAIAFIHTLEEWNSTAHIDSIALRLTDTILLRRDEGFSFLCQKICEEFHGNYFHNLMIDHLLQSLQLGIQRNENDTLCYLWEVLESLSENPHAMKREVTKLIMPELFEVIYKDSETLFDTRNFLAFWKKLGQEKSDYERLANQLVDYGQLFWKKEGFEEKGTNLLRLASEFSIEKQICQNKIETFLCDLYRQAENCNMIHRLSLIHDALDAFHVGIKEVGSYEKLANHLADAEYLYEARNWEAAKTHAAWVLKLDPRNLRAQRLVGLACFHMGDYERALAYLRDLPALDESAHRAIAFSRVYEEQAQQEHLVQIDNINSFNEDE